QILSFLLNWALYGALCAQVYLYYLAFPEDRPLNKVLVYSVFMVETLQSMLLLHGSIRTYDVTSPLLFLIGPYDITLWIAIPLLGGIAAFLVQTFYAYRLCILAHSWAMMIFIVLLALVQLVLEIIGGGRIPGPAFPNTTLFYSIIWGSFSIACDLLIAISMTYFLLCKDTGWKTSHALLVKLVRLAIETGTVTGILQVSVLKPPFIVKPPVAIMPPLTIFLGKVYSNAMMVNFNHRLEISGGRNETQIVGLPMPSHLPTVPS
ncbi:hypothetical protein L208DRAFT_1273638, partial [Tricholoma matsutake]